MSFEARMIAEHIRQRLPGDIRVGCRERFVVINARAPHVIAIGPLDCEDSALVDKVLAAGMPAAVVEDEHGLNAALGEWGLL